MALLNQIALVLHLIVSHNNCNNYNLEKKYEETLEWKSIIPKDQYWFL